MKKILSERNFAAVLFILVMVVFSFAHEDSKKRNNHYNASTPGLSSTGNATSFVQNTGKVNQVNNLEKSEGKK